MANLNSESQRRNTGKCTVALVLIDVINDLVFEGSEALLNGGLHTANRIAELKRRSKDAGIPVIYVNDNFGRWRSDFAKLVNTSIHEDPPKESIVDRLLPEPDDYFVLKPRHSAFHATQLDLLLRRLGSRILILAGLTVDNCVLFTARAAHARDYQLVMPEDCVGARTLKRKREVLRILEHILAARTTRSSELDLIGLLKSTALTSSESLAKVA
jgi:nicotinamidase-related amidase